MTRSAPRHRRPSPAFTLLELSIALVLTTLVVGSLTSAILITTKAMQQATPASSSFGPEASAEVLEELADNLRLAISFTERTPTAVTFTLPDRTGDGEPDTMRYAWAGTPEVIEPDGAALTVALNGGNPVVISDDVHYFDLEYVATSIAGSGGTSEGALGASIQTLMVVHDSTSLRNEEQLRKFMLESWGHSVSVIDDEEPQATYDAAFAVNDIVYVAGECNADKLDEKVMHAPIGVVAEQSELAEELDLCTDDWRTNNASSIIIDDATHYVTTPFFPGLLPIMLDDEALMSYDDVLASGAQLLASEPGEPTRAMLLVIETGATLYSGSPALGRRVILPWAENADFAQLNPDGLWLMRRSFEWAAGKEVPDEIETPLFAQNEDPSTGDLDYTIKADKWAVASVVPNLPADALGWTVARVRVLAQQKGTPDQTLVVQLRRRAADGAPLGEILAQKFVFESDLPLTYDWVEIEFMDADEILPTEGVCIAVGMLGGSDGGQVLYESGFGDATPSNQFYEGTPGDWDDPNTSQDMPCEVFGSVRVPAAL